MELIFSEEQLVEDRPANRIGNMLIWASGLEMDVSDMDDHIIAEFKSLPAYAVVQIADMEEDDV